MKTRTKTLSTLSPMLFSTFSPQFHMFCSSDYLYTALIKMLISNYLQCGITSNAELPYNVEATYNVEIPPMWNYIQCGTTLQ